MRKRWKIVLGVMILIFVLVAISPSPEEESKVITKTETATQTPTTLAEQIQNEIKTTWVDVENVEYFETTKHVNIEFVKETAWDNEHLRDSFAYACFDIMQTLVKYPDKIDSVTLIGKTTLIDPQGHKEIGKVFQAEVTMDKAKNVAWENLADLGTLEPLNNNFDDVWWHMAVQP